MLGVGEEGGVGVDVSVDEAWGYGHSGGVDESGGDGFGEVADGCDAAFGDAYVGSAAGAACSVHDCSACDHYVEHAASVV